MSAAPSRRAAPSAATRIEFLDDVALADVAFRVRGPSLEGVFAAAAAATLSVMVANLEQVQEGWARDAGPREAIELGAAAADLLLYDFLAEIIFRKDARAALTWPVELTVTGPEAGGPGSGWRLRGELAEMPLGGAGMELLVDVKAVTMHRLRLAPEGDGWVAEAVLDL